MADRVSVSISIGGDLPENQRGKLVGLVVDQGLSLEWDGPDFDFTQFPDDGPLTLYAHEVAWGRLDDLEGFVSRTACRSYAGRAAPPASSDPNA